MPTPTLPTLTTTMSNPNIADILAQIAAQTNLLIQQNAQNHQQATGAAPGYQQPRAQPVFEEAFFSSAANAEMINGLASGLAQQFMQGRGAGSDAMAAMARTLAQSFAESAAQAATAAAGAVPDMMNTAAGSAENLRSASSEFVNRVASEGVRVAQSVHPTAGDLAQMASQAFVQATGQGMQNGQRVGTAVPTPGQPQPAQPTVGMTLGQQQAEQQAQGEQDRSRAAPGPVQPDWAKVAQAFANMVAPPRATTYPPASQAASTTTQVPTPAQAPTVPQAPCDTSPQPPPSAPTPAPAPAAPSIIPAQVNLSLPSAVTLKVKLGDDLRRMTLDGENLDYAQLCTVINVLFALPCLDSYRITYIDIDGDSVRIASNPDLQEALSFAMSQRGKTLRINLTQSTR